MYLVLQHAFEVLLPSHGAVQVRSSWRVLLFW
jgi:hypothetical protein